MTLDQMLQPEEIRLRAGELTPEEVRLAQALIRWGFAAGQRTEREACAQIADNYPIGLPLRHRTKNLLPRVTGQHEGAVSASATIAGAIRARGAP